jgi:aminoglycoside 2'-N-acetyltransferase I
LGAVIRLAHTADLEPALLDEVWEMLVDVFEGDIEASDWEHALGGMHALAYDADERLVGHASVVQRRLIHGGRALRTGYVEAVGVRAGARRQGHAGALMDAIERVIRGAYEIGALGASDMALAFYRGRGWLPWEGETYALTPDGIERTPDDDDSLHVLEVAATLDRSARITCDWRDGAVW